MPQTVRIEWHGQRVKAAARRGALRGLATAAEHLLALSRREVPIEEGTLERSGRAEVDAAAMRGSVSYDTPYAVRQHEELTWRHDPGRNAKYLEGPLNREAGTLQGLIAAEIRRSLR
jgi:hypothetical protein